ncbi:hypothetical protein ACFSCX_13315 [Bacillus salitolerans]|uniref:Uncharacterized protein n=1 Tax=Bacillus salitolerans TaxID=1437434 RepID=A0ABW4LTW9_9BACI
MKISIRSLGSVLYKKTKRKYHTNIGITANPTINGINIAISS